MDALIVYSGGMDSTTLLYEYKNHIKLAVNFQYGSKHNEREVLFARKNTEILGIPLIEIDLAFIGKYFKSDLLKTGGQIPYGHYTDQSMKRTVVPFRNGIMLSIAAGLAESNNLDTILIANHAGDHAIYPDCRASFIDAMRDAIINGTYKRVELYAPYTYLTKREIALRGKELGVDYLLTYSCYEGDEIHCGKCGTCTERKEALEGFDPTAYKS